MICGQGGDVNVCVLVRSSLICVKIANGVLYQIVFLGSHYVS